MATNDERRDADDVELESSSEQPRTGEEPEPELTVEEILRGERDELQDRWLRLVAEMDNLRKRTRREVEDARRFAVAGAVRPLLDVLDDFDRALLHAAGADGGEGLAVLRAGVELVAQNFRQALLDQGVREIDALGCLFDPNLHEAVGEVPAPEGADSGVVVQVVQKGFVLGELVLRPSRVLVAQ